MVLSAISNIAFVASIGCLILGIILLILTATKKYESLSNIDSPAYILWMVSLALWIVSESLHKYRK